MDAVILAAGKSRGLRPLTSTRPKPMIPVGGKPMIEWNLEALSKSSVNFEQVIIVVGFKQEKIKEYLVKYLFSWSNIPGDDKDKLIKFLKDEFNIDWAENAEIHKSNDRKTICILRDENSVEIMMDEKKEKATLKISDGRTHDLKVKKEDDKLNIYLGNKFKDIKIEYVEQKELLGTAHAVSVVEDKVGDEFLVINGDLIVSSDFIDDLVKKHREHKSSATLSLRQVEDPSGFGMVELNRPGGHIIKNIIEKPKIKAPEKSKRYCVNAGVYIFNENIFKAIRRIREAESVEYDIPKAINVLTKAASRNLVHGFECDGMWMSIRRPWDLLDANEILLKNMKFLYLFSWDNIPGKDDGKLRKFLEEDVGLEWAENAEIHKSNADTTINISKDENSVEIMMDAKKEKATLKISDGRTHDLKVKKEDDKLNLYKFHKLKGKIEDYAVIKGDVYIGENTVIKSGAYIESVDEKGKPLPCYIGSNTEVRPGSHIKGPCYIGDKCIIGPNCFIRPHTSLGDWVHIGNAVDIKNSIVMSNTLICHLAYVADSIIGEGCNLDAGTKIQNLEFENLKISKFSVIGDNIRVKVMHEFVNSGRSKFGAILGDEVKTGINVSIMPGVSIYPEAWIEAGSVVRNPIYTEGEEI